MTDISLRLRRAARDQEIDTQRRHGAKGIIAHAAEIAVTKNLALQHAEWNLGAGLSHSSSHRLDLMAAEQISTGYFLDQDLVSYALGQNTEYIRLKLLRMFDLFCGQLVIEAD